MIDKRFYEHREQDLARSLMGLLLVGLAMFVMACFIGATITANELGCPRWLSGAYPMQAETRVPCFTSPISGIIWNFQYRIMPTPVVRRNIASWSPVHRRRLYRALGASFAAMVFGGIATVVAVALLAIRFIYVAKNYRPMHKGTRFWATDEEVFKTGLAVNYRASILSRIRGLFR